MEYPLVSAIITTHNRKDLVIGAIKSVMDQTYPNIETIVVDDGSTDGTEKYIEETLKDASIRYFYNADMPGGNHARNIGIKHSKGEYLAFWMMTMSGCLQRSKNRFGIIWIIRNRLLSDVPV